MTVNGQFTYPEISVQHEALQAAWKQLDILQDWIVSFLANPVYDEVVFIGSGSSYYQALIMAGTCRSWLKRSASAYPSSELFLFKEQMTLPNRKYLVIGVSRSGESTEVVLALESVKADPHFTIAGITCYESSTMAKIAPCLVSPHGKETSTVMTKSFSSMTFMMQAAIAKAAGSLGHVTNLESVMNSDKAVVAAADLFIKQIVNRNTFTKYIYLGMGSYYGAALEACLKIKEMSNVWTEAYGTLEFRHGPKSIVEPGTMICMLLSQKAREYELKVAQEMKHFGAYVLLITAKKDVDTAFADAVLEIGGDDVSDEARTVLYLPALQYLGYYTAMKRNLNPDTPRNLTQVVVI